MDKERKHLLTVDQISRIESVSESDVIGFVNARAAEWLHENIREVVLRLVPLDKEKVESPANAMRCDLLRFQAIGHKAIERVAVEMRKGNEREKRSRGLRETRHERGYLLRGHRRRERQIVRLELTEIRQAAVQGSKALLQIWEGATPGLPIGISEPGEERLKSARR
jgi:hypothetical protein